MGCDRRFFFKLEWTTELGQPEYDASGHGNCWIKCDYRKRVFRSALEFIDLRLAASPGSLRLLLIPAGLCDIYAFVATDGQRLYAANVGTDFTGSVSWVFAVDIDSKTQYAFPRGGQSQNGTQICGSRVNGVIDSDANAATRNGARRQHVPSGIAVQTAGSILAVAHGTFLEEYKPGAFHVSASEDVILLFDKTSGALLGGIQIADPRRIAFDNNGDLWAITQNNVVRITDVGGANTVVTQLPGLDTPLAIAVDPTTNDVLVADGGHTQQVKRFGNDGQFLTSYGDAGGYNDCNPTVTPTRLYLDETAGFGSGNERPGTFIAVLPDSSFWVGDVGNARVLHVSSSGQYLEQISFQRFLYSVGVDHGAPTRVFGDFLEYSVDYSKPLVAGDPAVNGTGSWGLVKNWSVCVPVKYHRPMAGRFMTVHTYGNGKTFATLDNPDFNSWPELVELPASGPLRLTGTILQQNGTAEQITNEGDLGYSVFTSDNTNTNTTQKLFVQSLKSYARDGTPYWSNPKAVASVTAAGTPLYSSMPIGQSGPISLGFPEPTTSGVYVTFSSLPAQQEPSFHLGGVSKRANDWKWKASPGAKITTPDGQGTFTDVDNGVNGVGVLVEGNNIFEGYNGNWASFSNQWMHWWEDGLMVGQFGQPTSNGRNSDGSLFDQAAGNILRMSTVSVNGNVYLYHGDEGYHPGIHRWKISGLDSISEMRGKTKSGGTVSLR